MADYSILPLHILKQVFACFYRSLKAVERIYLFRQLLPPAAVCRVWRELTLQYVYHTAHLEYRLERAKGVSETSKPASKWLSNIGLVVSQRCSNTVRCLRIESLEHSLDLSEIILAMDTLGLSTVHWSKIVYLEIWGRLQNSTGGDGILGSNSDDVAATKFTEYFAQHIPNIAHLKLTLPNRHTSISQLTSNKLVNLYVGQLRSINCVSHPISFSRHSFSSNLTSLQVMMSSEATYQLPQMLASSLQVLALYDIPHIFSWYSFISYTHGHVTFANLRRLLLSFDRHADDTLESTASNGLSEASAAAFTTNHRQLHFPMLRSLDIRSSPYSDSALYSVFVGSPLQLVKLDSSLKSALPMDTRILPNVSDFKCSIYDVLSHDHDVFAQFSCRLLSCVSAVRTAELKVYDSDLPMAVPEQINWTNLRSLYIDASLSFSSAVKVIAQLTRLHKFSVGDIVQDGTDADLDIQAVLSEGSVPASLVSTSLTTLQIYWFGNETITTSLEVICCLILLTRSLGTLVLSNRHVPDVQAFAANNAYRFPHLRKILVEGCY